MEQAPVRNVGINLKGNYISVYTNPIPIHGKYGKTQHGNHSLIASNRAKLGKRKRCGIISKYWIQRKTPMLNYHFSQISLWSRLSGDSVVALSRPMKTSHDSI